jgi:hypothetical protein
MKLWVADCTIRAAKGSLCEPLSCEHRVRTRPEEEEKLSQGSNRNHSGNRDSLLRQWRAGGCGL